MNDSQENKCHAIIHSTATICAGVGAGMAQVPGSDSLVIVPIQVGMIISLGAVFGIELDESAAKASLATATATMVGRGISQALVGWIPGWGNAINASTAFTSPNQWVGRWQTVLPPEKHFLLIHRRE